MLLEDFTLDSLDRLKNLVPSLNFDFYGMFDVALAAVRILPDLLRDMERLVEQFTAEQQLRLKVEAELDTTAERCRDLQMENTRLKATVSALRADLNDAETKIEHLDIQYQAAKTRFEEAVALADAKRQHADNLAEQARKDLENFKNGLRLVRDLFYSGKYQDGHNQIAALLPGESSNFIA